MKAGVFILRVEYCPSLVVFYDCCIVCRKPIKGKAQEPYILHLEEVSELVTSWNFTGNAIAAAWLHDTVEDCPPSSFAEIENEFNVDIANIVRELTDDKSLPKAQRKRLQIVNAIKKSEEGCLIKLADKCSNIAAIANSPPIHWNAERKRDYVAWACSVLDRLPHKPEVAVQAFESRCKATISQIARET